jgi:hypothetical protein
MYTHTHTQIYIYFPTHSQKGEEKGLHVPLDVEPFVVDLQLV